MARARNIKPSFFTNDELAELEPLARLLFISLWTLADYKGCIVWREKRIKVQTLPYDNCDISKLAINLDKSGFIRFYSDKENIYLKVVNFDAHQNPHKNEREKGSDIPDYSEEMRQSIDIKGNKITSRFIAINLDKNGTDPADSLNLIPDSFNPPTAKPASRFDDWWSVWPKKVGKEAALKKWKSLKCDEIVDRLIADVELRKEKHWDWIKDNGQYIPNPATYLNGKRWEDQITELPEVSNNGSYQQAHRKLSAAEQAAADVKRYEAATGQQNNPESVAANGDLVRPPLDG